MLINVVEYIKWWFFDGIDWNFCVLSDFEIPCKNFFKLQTLEPVWTVLHYSQKFEFVFVILNSLNSDNLARLYKYNLKNVCVINLNSWFSWIGKKWIYPDMDDIYIKENVDVWEIIDFENLKVYINNFFKNKEFTYIRVPDLEFEENLVKDNSTFDYSKIVNFDQFSFSWYSASVLVYWSLLPEVLQALGNLRQDWISCDLFRTWNYKTQFDSELIESIHSHDLIFIVWDFSANFYKDFLFSRFYDAELEKKNIYFINPVVCEPKLREYLQENAQISANHIYQNIKTQIESFE